MTNDTESNLVRHARTEMDRIGLFDADADYDGMLGEAALDLIRLFAEQGHSGLSASMTIDLFTKLAKFEPLSALTDNPDEWIQHSEEVSGREGGLWQSKRRADAFSTDGGKTYYCLDDEPGTLRHTETSSPEAAYWTGE